MTAFASWGSVKDFVHSPRELGRDDEKAVLVALRDHSKTSSAPRSTARRSAGTPTLSRIRRALLRDLFRTGARDAHISRTRRRIALEVAQTLPSLCAAVVRADRSAHMSVKAAASEGDAFGINGLLASRGDRDDDRGGRLRVARIVPGDCDDRVLTLRDLARVPRDRAPNPSPSRSGAFGLVLPCCACASSFGVPTNAVLVSVVQ
jgi:hypothetical protein